MKVLVVTNMYPDALRPYNGIFVAEQMAAIKRYHTDVDYDVCYIEGENKGKAEYLKSIFRVNHTISHGHYDIVHIHFGISGIYLLSPFRKKLPTIVTFHGSDIQPSGGNGRLTIAISKFVAHTADACITLNEKMDALVKQYNANTFMVPCAVDTQVFYPQRKETADRKKLIVFPSSHDMEVKNYPLFCEVINLLQTRHGIDCEERELTGLSRTEVADLFNTADLLLMTSHSEGSPQAVKEALACNLPVVATPVGDVATLLEGVRNCSVSHTHCAQELARLAKDSLLGAGIGIEGRQRITQLHLDTKSVSDNIYRIYEQSIH